jgi:hypothetical protein
MEKKQQAGEKSPEKNIDALAHCAYRELACRRDQI